MLNITIINNTIAINENTVGVLTDSAVAEILAYAVSRMTPATAGKSTKSTSNAEPKPKKTTSSTKKSNAEPKPNLGYVVTVRGVEHEAFKALEGQLLEKFGAKYHRKKGFAFKAKADAEKAMAEYKDVTWKVLGEM